MDVERLQELERQIARQQAVLVTQQQALRAQQERVDALLRELELVRAVLSDKPAGSSKKTELCSD